MVPTGGDVQGKAEVDKLGSEGAPISPAQFAALIEMVGPDMPEVVVEIVDTYVQEADDLITALEVARANGQTPEMLRPAHSLKSSSASLGAMRLSELSAQLEAHARGYDDTLDASAQIDKIREEYGRVVEGLAVEKQRLIAG